MFFNLLHDGLNKIKFQQRFSSKEAKFNLFTFWGLSKNQINDLL